MLGLIFKAGFVAAATACEVVAKGANGATDAHGVAVGDAEGGLGGGRSSEEVVEADPVPDQIQPQGGSSAMEILGGTGQNKNLLLRPNTEKGNGEVGEPSTEERVHFTGFRRPKGTMGKPEMRTCMRHLLLGKRPPQIAQAWRRHHSGGGKE